jgi:hypothetical protein
MGLGELARAIRIARGDGSDLDLKDLLRRERESVRRDLRGAEDSESNWTLFRHDSPHASICE